MRLPAGKPGQVRRMPYTEDCIPRRSHLRPSPTLSFPVPPNTIPSAMRCPVRGTSTATGGRISSSAPRARIPCRERMPGRPISYTEGIRSRPRLQRKAARMWSIPVSVRGIYPAPPSQLPQISTATAGRIWPSAPPRLIPMAGQMRERYI